MTIELKKKQPKKESFFLQNSEQKRHRDSMHKFNDIVE